MRAHTLPLISAPPPPPPPLPLQCGRIGLRRRLVCVGKGVEMGGGYGSEVLPGRRVAWIEVHVSRHHNKYGFPFWSSPTMHITLAYNVRIVHPIYIYKHCTLGIWVTYRMKMRTGNTFVVLHMYLEISNSHIQGAVLDKQVWLLPGRQHTCTSK